MNTVYFVGKGDNYGGLRKHWEGICVNDEWWKCWKTAGPCR